MFRDPDVRKAALAILLTLVVLCLDLFMFTPARGSELELAKLPPTYLSGVVVYDEHSRFKAMLLGSTRFLSCKEALDDSKSALVKAAELAPPGSRSEGICIPLHTYSYADLIPTTPEELPLGPVDPDQS